MRRYIKALMHDERHTALDAVPKAVLWLLSLMYGLIMRGRNVSYDRGWKASYDVDVPVISVGNITMGGAGKTPLVVFIARQLQEAKAKPVILLRGYMQDQRSSADSDEAELLRRKLPGVEVIIGADRVARAREYLGQGHCDVFILDDAFQHRRIKRQLDVVAVDSLNPFGNGQLIPRGILREPLDGLRRADLCVLTRADLDPVSAQAAFGRLREVVPEADPVMTVHRPRALICLGDGREVLPGDLAGIRVTAFSGVGNPEGFRRTLEVTGMAVADFTVFEDHHVYSEEDIRTLSDRAQGAGAQTIVTTLKDAVKIDPLLSGFGNITAYYLDIDIDVTHGKEEFIRRIRGVLRR